MNSWNQARLQAYIVAQVNSKKKLKPTDIISFPWDSTDKPKGKITDEDKTDAERLKKLSETYSNIIK